MEAPVVNFVLKEEFPQQVDWLDVLIAPKDNIKQILVLLRVLPVFKVSFKTK